MLNLLHKYHVNELQLFNISVFIRKIGASLVSIFIPIYLFENGYTIKEIILFFAILAITLIILIFPLSKIIARFGQKHAMLYSTPFEVAVYLGLIFFVNTPMIIFVPMCMAVYMILYNLSYHLVFIHNSHTQRRGTEIANLGILVILANVISPYLGGLFAAFNFNLLFLISASIIFMSSIPLFISKDNFEKITFKPIKILSNIIHKDYRGLVLSFCAYGSERVIDIIIWPIVIILLVGKLDTAGLVVSLSVILSILSYRVIGKLSDRMGTRKLITIGTLAHSIGWFLRIFAQGFLSIIIIDSYKNIALNTLHVPWIKETYEQAIKNDYFGIIVMREMIFQIARLITYGILLLVFFINIYPFTVSIIFAAVINLGYRFILKKKLKTIHSSSNR